MVKKTINSRFAEERRRTGLSHAKIADICGVAKTSVISWEKGTKIPADALATLMDHGMDAFFILAGRKKEGAQSVMLQQDEIEIIDGYRSLNEEDQQWFGLMIDAKVKQSAEKGTNKNMRKK